MKLLHRENFKFQNSMIFRTRERERPRERISPSDSILVFESRFKNLSVPFSRNILSIEMKKKIHFFFFYYFQVRSFSSNVQFNNVTQSLIKFLSSRISLVIHYRKLFTLRLIQSILIARSLKSLIKRID